MKRNDRSRIDEFLALKRIAIVGMSRDARSLSHQLADELLRRDYDVVPVNPSADDIAGVPCFPSVDAVEPGVDGAIIMLPAAQVDAALTECADAGIHRVWIQRGCVSPNAVTIAEERGLSIVLGECMFMFLPDAGFIHRLHAGIDKLIGRYPI